MVYVRSCSSPSDGRLRSEPGLRGARGAPISPPLPCSNDRLGIREPHDAFRTGRPAASDCGYSPQPIGNTSNGAARATPSRWPVWRAIPSRNSRGVEVLPAQAVDVGAVRLQRRDAGVEGVGGVDGVRRTAGTRRPTRRRPRPTARGRRSSCSGKTQRLPASRTASSDRLADGDVVGLVEVGPAPGVAEVAGDHDLGPVPADHLGDGAAQRHAVLQDAVGQAEEVDVVDADDPRRLDLLGLADGAALLRGAGRRCRPRRW